MMEPLAKAYAVADVAFPDWWPDGAKPVYEHHGWTFHVDMRPAEAVVEEEEDALEGALIAPLEEACERPWPRRRRGRRSASSSRRRLPWRTR
jgi:hypothetical protein